MKIIFTLVMFLIASTVHAQGLDLRAGSSSVVGPNVVRLTDLTYDKQRYTVNVYLSLNFTWSLIPVPPDALLDLNPAGAQIVGSDSVRLSGLKFDGTAYDASVRINLDGTWTPFDIVLSSATDGTTTGDRRLVTQGPATTLVNNLFPGCPGSRVSGMGTITAADGTRLTVPAETAFQTGPQAFDLFNDCTDVRPNGISAVNLNQVPVTEIDADGEVVTGYIFADNYFELYVNGTLVGVDPVPFTPFNSNLVRFKVKAPYTYAIKLVDWEENLGLGSEDNRGNLYHPGDGGFIAVFSDGTVTDATWKAQTFYIAPLENAELVQEQADGTRSSSSAGLTPNCDASCYAVHYTLPDNWTAPAFDDSAWPAAVTYSNQTVGVDNKPAFTNFAAQFAPGQFIWSSNLVLDNLVLARKTVGADVVVDNGSDTGTNTDTNTGSGDFALTSPAVKGNNILPFSYICDGLDAAGRRGGLSPALAFENAPAGTVSFAVTMHTAKGAGDRTEIESLWVLYDIPATNTSFAAGETGGGMLGLSEQGQNTYFPPCSHEPVLNEYTLTAYALPQPLGLNPATTDYAALTAAARQTALASATLTLSNVRYNPQEDLHVPTKVPSTCAEKAAAFAPYSVESGTGEVSLECDGATMTVTSHSGLPARSMLDGDKPNVGTEAWIGRVPLPKTTTWSFPVAPRYLDSISSNVSIHDPIGITVDGVPMLHYAKESFNGEIAELGKDYSDRDTVLLGELDQCGAHAGNGEDYHYHYAPLCMMDSHDPSQPLAYLFDGLPLYFGIAGGTVTEQGGRTSVNYGAGRYTDLDYRPQAVKNGSAALDECNAYDLDGDGAVSGYVYYTTKTAPYTIGCYRAKADQAGSSYHYPRWNNERDIAWSGAEVRLSDFYTAEFQGATWTFMEITPSAGNNKLPADNIGVVLYRPMTESDAGYLAGSDCWMFRYRLDKNDSTGANDMVAGHCRG